MFPTDLEIMLAEHESRKGNNTPITAIDKKIAGVLTEVPVDENKIYTQEEVDALYKKINEEPV